MPEYSDSMYSSIFMLQNIWYHHVTRSGRIHKKLLILLQFSFGPRGPIFRTKFAISCEFGLLQVNLWYHMISRMKIAFTSCHFLSKNGCQKYSIWVHWDLMPSCSCSVISLSEETNKFSELDCYTSVLFLLHSILVWFMSKKSHFI